ncbi:MAG: multicopper oxidase domain-containing protein, partial [Terriglobales bacterium]
DKYQGKPVDPDGLFSIFGTGFASENLRSSINGYMYANGPMMTMKKGERVRWYLISIGGLVDGHTPHWHGNVVLVKGHRTDVVHLAQAEMEVADMVPDNPGIWMYHCHVDDHMVTGMVACTRLSRSRRLLIWRFPKAAQISAFAMMCSGGDDRIEKIGTSPLKPQTGLSGSPAIPHNQFSVFASQL